MSHGKVCCNCNRCIRSIDDKYNIIICRCDVHDMYLSYASVMGGCCKHWAKKQEGEEIGGRMMIENITQENFGTLAICAIRYCHGRQTYMPDLVRNIIAPHLPDVSDKDLTVMIEDCEFQERMHLYGDERIDKPGWIRWKELLIAEKNRRANGEAVR